MTDDERIARLTELAKKVWPDAEVDADAKGAQAFVGTSAEWGFAVKIAHPRALDALEAALLVLSGEGKVLTREVFHEAVREAAIRIAKSWAESTSELEEALVPAWVEQLATEWDARAAECARKASEAHTRRDQELVSMYSTQQHATIWHAAELRERARGES